MMRTGLLLLALVSAAHGLKLKKKPLNLLDGEHVGEKLKTRCSNGGDYPRSTKEDSLKRARILAQIPEQMWKVKSTLDALPKEEVEIKVEEKKAEASLKHAASLLEKPKKKAELKVKTIKGTVPKGCGTCQTVDGAAEVQRIAKLDPNWKPTVKKAFYINLAASTGRRAAIENEIRRTAPGLDMERWPALNKEEAYAKYNENKGLFTDKGIDNGNAVAVYYSHATLLQHIHDIDPLSEDMYVIMEDDSTFHKEGEGWKADLSTLVNNGAVPADWDVIKMAYWGNNRCEDLVDGVFEMRGNTRKEEDFYNGNLVYAVRPKAIPNILLQMRDMGIGDFDAMLTSNHKEGEEQKDGKNYFWSHGIHSYAHTMSHAYMSGGSERLSGVAGKKKWWQR